MKAIFSCALVLLLGLNLSAQRHSNRGHHQHKDPILANASDLGLNEDQQNSIKEIREKVHEQAMAIRHSDASNEAQRAQLKALRQQARQDVQAVLTPAQQTRLAELEAEHKAQRETRQELREQVDREGLLDAITAYQETNIYPVKLAARKVLEQEISPADRSEIDRLRTAFYSRPKPQKRQGGEPQAAPRQREDRHQHRAEVQAWREAHEADLEALKALVTKYEAAIDQQFEQLKPQHEQWKADLEQIRANYIPAELLAADQGRGHRRGHHRGRHSATEDTPASPGKMKHKRHRAAFLLLDPEASPATLSLQESAIPIATTRFSVSPNPLVNAGVITLDVKAPTRITLNLLDTNGRVVKTIADREFKAGTHQVDLDLAGTNNGRYVIRLTDQAGSAAESIIVAQ